MASNSDTSVNLDALMVDEPPVGRIRGAVRTIMIVFVIAALVLNVNKIQLINFILDNFTPAAFFTWYTQNIYEPTLIIDTSYYYVIIGLLLSQVFLVYPFSKKEANHVPYYDWVLFALTIA